MQVLTLLFGVSWVAVAQARIINVTLEGTFSGTLQIPTEPADLYKENLVPSLIEHISKEFQVSEQQLPSIAAFLSNELAIAEVKRAQSLWADYAAKASSPGIVAPPRIMYAARDAAVVYDKLALHLQSELAKWRVAAEVLSREVIKLRSYHREREANECTLSSDRLEQIATLRYQAEEEIAAKNSSPRHDGDSEKFVEAIPRYQISRKFSMDQYSSLAKAGVPFILTGLNESWVHSWNIEMIRKQCGNAAVDVKRRIPQADTWGELVVEKTNMTIAAFIDDVLDGKGTGYVHDESLHRVCPEQPLLKEFKYPEPFSCNILSQHDASSGYSRRVRIPSKTPKTIADLHQYWPSLFLAAPGTSTALHSDFLDSAFFMVVLKGAKEFQITNRDDAFLLGPRGKNRYRNQNQAVFSKYARAWKGVVREKELIFIPSGCPHSVQNIVDEIGLAVSANFIDAFSGGRFLNASADFFASGFGYARDPRFSPANEHAAILQAEEEYLAEVKDILLKGGPSSPTNPSGCPKMVLDH